MKKLILTILLSLFMIETLHANKNFDVSLDIARVKKIDDVIKRVNSINSYINQYILDTADTTPTKKELVNHFGISLDLFKDYTYESDFDISLKDNKKVIYTSVVPDSLTPQQIKFYKHSKSLHPQAVVKDDLSIEITLDAKTQFLLSSINSLPSDSIVSNTEPTDTTKKWYKPDGLGGWSIYAYNSISSSWEILDNSKSKSSQASTQKTTILDSKEELNSLQALEGDIAYVKSDNNTSTDKYVYSGSRWLLESSASMVGKNSCSAEQLGVISYSQKNDCMQRCKKVADDKYTWECIKDSKEPKIYRTCYEIKQANPDAKDGVYTIDPDGKGEGEGGVEYFIYKHSQEQTNGAKSNIQVTGIYKKIV